MPWLQLIFETTQQECSLYSELLSDAGALSVTLEDAGDQPIYEPKPGEIPKWPDTRIIGLFEADTNLEELISLLETQIKPKKIANWQVEHLEDRDWTKEWTKDFHPIQIADQLWICPSWCEPPNPEAINIYMDPGLAFGSGTHATTVLCLEWLAQHQLSGLSITDYGCGSGILAITAAKLGAEYIWAIDNDPQALLSTQDNAKNNAVGNCIHTGLPGELEESPVDIVVANILALPLVELAGSFAQRLKPQGNIVLSGILPDQIDLITRTYERYFDIKPATIKDNWVRIEGTKRN